MLFRSNDTATTEIYTCLDTLSLHDALPFSAVLNIGDALDSFRKVERLAASPRHIVPGHDPLVMQRYPAVSPSLKGVVVRLDVDPME